MFGLAGSRRRREEVGEYVRGSLWVLPGIAVLVALIAGSVLSLVPVPRDGLLYKLVFQGTTDDARTLLIGTAGHISRRWKRRDSIGPHRCRLHAAAGSGRCDHHVEGTYGLDKTR
jgi:hypothetical protein